MDPISLILTILFFIFVGSLALATINKWINSKKKDNSSYAKLVKQELDNGNYKVVAGIFDRNGNRQSSEGWKTSKIESDLEQVFGSSDYAYIDL